MLLKGSYQSDLDEFCKDLLNSDFDIRHVTKGALSQAMAKLNPYAFKRLAEVAVDHFYKHASYTGWRGLRVIAVDGSGIKLPNSKDIAKEFGVYKVGRKANCDVSMAIGSMVFGYALWVF